MRVPYTYKPQSSKEAEEALQFDYDYEDLRTTEELKRDLKKCLARM